MKTKLLGLASIGLVIQSALAQGLVSISLTTAAVQTNLNGVSGLVNGSGQYYFQLLYSTNTSLPASARNIYGNPANFALWTDSGVTGVNGTGLSRGKIQASTGTSAAGWTAPGNSYDNLRSVLVVGWSANYGTSWAAVSNAIANGGLSDGYYGVSAVGTSYAGGGAASLPAVNAWTANGLPGTTAISPLGLTLDYMGLADPPYIWTQPADQLALAGTNLTLSVAASGSGVMYYKWWKGVNPIAGATNTSYQILNVGTNDAGPYSVVVSNFLGSVTSRVATVTVLIPPTISQYPTGQVVVAGNPATLTVVATGSPPLSYQWRKTSGPLAGATNATLWFNPARTNDWDDYSVTVSNTNAAVTTPPVTLVVYQPVNLAFQPQDRLVAYGKSATFSVGASGFPAPVYQWSLNGTNIPGAVSGSLTIGAVHLNHLGSYAVLVSNAYSSSLSSPATLTMLPSILTPFAGTTGIWGESAALNMTAAGSGTMAYQWYKDGVPVSGGTNATCTIPMLAMTDGGLYSVVVSSEYGSVTNPPAQLVVNPAEVSLGIYAGITIRGVAGYTYNIQASTNLADTNSWLNVTNLILEQPVQIWTDYSTNALARPHRYYRVNAGSQ